MNNEFKNESLFCLTSIAGDEGSGLVFRHFMYYEIKIIELLNYFFPKNIFGKDIDTILLIFYIEGTHNWFSMPSKIKIGRYSNKNKEIRISIPMCKDIIHKIHKKKFDEVFNYFQNSFLEIVKLLEQKKSIQNTDFNFEKLKFNCELFLVKLKLLLSNIPPNSTPIEIGDRASNTV